MSARARLEIVPELRVARPKETQRATFGARDATPSATGGATHGLKAAASAALRRNRERNAERNERENRAQLDPPKTLSELRSVELHGGDRPSDAADAPCKRGRRLLERLRWTGRRVFLESDGALAICPRLGTADPFGQAVAAHAADIAAALADEQASRTERTP